MQYNKPTVQQLGLVHILIQHTDYKIFVIVAEQLVVSIIKQEVSKLQIYQYTKEETGFGYSYKSIMMK